MVNDENSRICYPRIRIRICLSSSWGGNGEAGLKNDDSKQKTLAETVHLGVYSPHIDPENN